MFAKPFLPNLTSAHVWSKRVVCVEQHWGRQWDQFWSRRVAASWCWSSGSTTILSKGTKLHRHPSVHCSAHLGSTCHWDGLSGTWKKPEWGGNNFYGFILLNDCEHLALHVCIYMCIIWRKKPVLVEPPASFVFLGAVSFVVIVVLVVGAEFDALVTGPPWHTNLIISRQSISSCTCVGSKGESVVILQREVRGELEVTLKIHFLVECVEY